MQDIFHCPSRCFSTLSHSLSPTLAPGWPVLITSTDSFDIHFSQSGVQPKDHREGETVILCYLFCQFPPWGVILAGSVPWLKSQVLKSGHLNTTPQLPGSSKHSLLFPRPASTWYLASNGTPLFILLCLHSASTVESRPTLNLFSVLASMTVLSFVLEIWV